MFDASQWSISNLLTGHSLAIILVYVTALVLVGLLHVAFRGSVVV